MINEREEFLSYINFPEYISHSKQDYGYLGRFTLEMFEDLTGFNRVLTILARGYMFDEEGNADIKRAEKAICAWCSVPDKKNAKPLEDWQYITDFRGLHDEYVIKPLCAIHRIVAAHIDHYGSCVVTVACAIP